MGQQEPQFLNPHSTQAMQYEHILAENQDGVFVITINRESKMNALNIPLLQEIRHAVESVQQEAAVKGIIITGKGSKAFAAGADIAEFADFDVMEGTKMSAGGHDVMNAIENSAKLVVAAVNGFALGGGCELAMACHLRVASQNAKFGQPEVNLGVPPGYGGTQRLIQLIGKGRAIEMLLTGDPMNAEKALQTGLVNHVVPQEELMDFTKALIDKVASKSPSAVRMVIDCVNDYYRCGIDGFKREIFEFGKAFETEDFKEGTQAFLEKRGAKFSGR
jgi:enoyl-CoA hydratase